MPRTDDTRTAKHTFSERTAVVRTRRTDCVKVVANTRQQNFSFVDGDFFHLAVAEVESICEVNFFESHCSCQATLTRWPIFSFLVLRYLTNESCGSTSRGTRSITFSPACRSAWIFEGLSDMTRTERRPSSRRISAHCS